MSLQFENPECGHMETDDAPCRCNCYVRRHGIPVPIDGQGEQVADPLAWMDEPTHTQDRTAYEREWIAAMRKRHADVTAEGGTGEYVMWLEERLYALEARR